MIDKFLNELKKNNVILTPLMLEQFKVYYDMLIEENKTTNLTRITSEEDAYFLHFFDSLMVSKAISLDSFSLLDIGAGPGFPSIPLKIYYGEKDNCTIYEATNKKVVFMNKVIEALKLTNIQAHHLRAEESKEFNSFDYITTRAVTTILEQLKYSAPLLKEGGELICMKGSKGLDELKESKSLLKKLHMEEKEIIPYKVLDRDYYLIVIKKNGKR